MSIIWGITTFLLILVAVFLILVVLAQKAKSDGGAGAALGGGMAEAAFGADTGNVLSKSTIYAAIAFFVLTLGLYLGRIAERKNAHTAAGDALPTINAPAVPDATPATAPITTTPSAATPATAPASTATLPTEAPKSP
ncbi:MAG TPA: preprotein translocase subunit SecG [Opitutaceae bacterium]|nr:preprotein translocase subunit SecG [Opitutaceae bacterium]